ncbi:hypothetical protein [Halorussus lipolyticus]|uniref:hypothetical protein n=1 Tax=Halorussus lipolyticus TaxID=3034024 RepID=UPI0023E7DC9A|nr:hypothetical protein [Halorussus sp. DT80]
MPTHHIASWLVKHSDIPLTVVKPVATKLGISTNYLGAALFAGQIVYENQGTIVKYANTGGAAIGGFLHDRAAEKYGEDHSLTQYLGENVEALNEAFEGTEEEAINFAEAYRQFRSVDRDTPDVADEIDLPSAESGVGIPGTEKRLYLPGTDDLPDKPEVRIPDAVREAVPERPDSDPENAVDIPVSESE